MPGTCPYVLGVRFHPLSQVVSCFLFVQMSRPPPPLVDVSNPRAAPPLRGAISTSHLEQGTKHAIRGADQMQRSSSLRTVDLDETSSLSVQQQLAEVLTKEAVRVIDLFREWDEDGDGMVSRKEFRKAMPLLGLQVPRPEVDALFDSWDPDGSGELSLRELSQRIKRRVEVPKTPQRKPLRKYEHGMSAMGRQPLSGAYIIAYRPHAHCMCTACTLHAHCMCATCTLHAHCMCATCTLHAHCIDAALRPCEPARRLLRHVTLTRAARLPAHGGWSHAGLPRLARVRPARAEQVRPYGESGPLGSA